MSPFSPHWRPTASIEHLKQRSEMLARIRTFFAERGVWEVETPLLARTTASDPHITSLAVSLGAQTGYLQTSPEFAMKRLIAAGSGSIYQLSKAFRAEEAGRLHHLEFTMLEWYRIGFDHHQLMDEVDALLHALLNTTSAERLTYRDAFKRHVEFDPFLADETVLAQFARRQPGLSDVQNPHPGDVDFWYHLIMSHCIEPHLGRGRPTFITDFPASQAALARIRQDGSVSVAERFEVYVNGIELANGYHELNDVVEQKQRFLADNQRRRMLGLPEMPLDTCLVAALEHGLPDCAGIALGIDRLAMLVMGVASIKAAISFVGAWC